MTEYANEMKQRVGSRETVKKLYVERLTTGMRRAWMQSMKADISRMTESTTETRRLRHISPAIIILPAASIHNTLVLHLTDI